MNLFNKITERNLKLTKSRQNLLTKLHKEGYTLSQIEYVVKNKKTQWEKDSKMCQYVRPATLFAFANFEKYVDEEQIKDASGQILQDTDEDELEIYRKMFS